MRKILAILVLVAIAGIAASVLLSKKSVFATPETKACARVNELCASDSSVAQDPRGHPDPRADLEHCVDAMTGAKKVAGQKAVDQSVQCINEATTCGKAMGCVVGGVGVGTVKEVLKGVGDAVTR